MPEPFDAIGFQITDDASYKALAEEAHQLGALSKAHRPQGTLHGCCWSLGSGLEVWTVLYESAKGMFYADCRPAFRGQRLIGFYTWEILEYEEDGEAIVRGAVLDSPLEFMFALQNITEINPLDFRERLITAAVAGLAYKARVSSRSVKPTFEPMTDHPRRRRKTETDYTIRGKILSWREMHNPRTQENLYWVDVDAGKLKIEVIINRADLKGELKPGAWLSAETWLQGHILNDRDLMARYEGVDHEASPSDWWIKLRRDN
ncbi:MAG: DUF3881 family protein [Blastocatellia bacterium]